MSIPRESEIMKDHEERVREEKSELDVKITKLTAFVNSPSFKTLSAVHSWWLSRQLEVMGNYSSVLHARIALFAKES